MIDAQTLMQWTGCTLGVAGSIALARNDRFSGWGFVAYLASNAAWLAYGYANDIPALALQHSVFAAVSAFGVWRWLVLPRILARLDDPLVTHGQPPRPRQRPSSRTSTAQARTGSACRQKPPAASTLQRCPLQTRYCGYVQARLFAAQLSALQSEAEMCRCHFVLAGSSDRMPADVEEHLSLAVMVARSATFAPAEPIAEHHAYACARLAVTATEEPAGENTATDSATP